MHEQPTANMAMENCHKRRVEQCFARRPERGVICQSQIRSMTLEAPDEVPEGAPR